MLKTNTNYSQKNKGNPFNQRDPIKRIELLTLCLQGKSSNH
ncbi:hypothetical protein pb186bvf_006017 [Paramecium bursaria]